MERRRNQHQYTWRDALHLYDGRVNLIRFQTLSKSFDRRPVLHDVFLRLARKERVGLIGKNGSGKTI